MYKSQNLSSWRARMGRAIESITIGCLYALLGLAAIAISAFYKLYVTLRSSRSPLAIPSSPLPAMISRAASHPAGVDLQTLLSGISDCYLEIDREYNVGHMNHSACNWFGLDEQGPQVSLWSLKPYGSRASTLVREVLESGVAAQVELASATVPGRWLDFRVYPSASGVSVFFRDITERRRAINKASEIKDLLQSSLNAMPAPLAIIDHRGEIAFKNTAWEELAAQSASFGAFASANEPDRRAPKPKAKEMEPTTLTDLLTRLRAGANAQMSIAIVENERHLRVKAASFGIAKNQRTVVVVDDLTEITVARNAVQELSESLLSIQEAERRRIAGELHDSTAQHLVAVSLDLMRLEQPDGDRLKDRRLITEMQELIEKALTEIRSLSYLLYPPSVDARGLESSMRSFVEGFSRRSDLDVTVDFGNGCQSSLSNKAQSALMHVVQEALLNAHRHAHASHVWITARLRGGWLRVHVLDDGIGTGSNTDSSFGTGVGISGMRWRLTQVGGKLTILTGRRGTAIVAAIPVSTARTPAPRTRTARDQRVSRNASNGPQIETTGCYREFDNSNPDIATTLHQIKSSTSAPCGRLDCDTPASARLPPLSDNAHCVPEGKAATEIDHAA